VKISVGLSGGVDSSVAAAKGQSAVLYRGDEVLGGGIITEAK